MDTKKLRQKILDLAIRGKLVPQDPNDEPASVLLERIRAEKERLIKEGKIKRSKKSASDTPHYENVPFEIPKSWRWTCMAEVNEYNSASVDPSKSPNNDFELYSVPAYETGMPEFVTGKDISSSKKSVSKNDVLLCKINPHLNRAWIVSHYKENRPCLASSEWIIFRNSSIIPQYLSFCFTSNYFKELMLSNVSGVGGSLMRAQQAIVNKYLFPLPPIEEQKRIVAAIEKWFSLIDTLESAKEDLRTSIEHTKSKILDLAIHGKLVPQDPNEEPAIELLKRINPSFTPCDNAHYPFDVPHNWVWAKGLDIFKPMKATSPLGDTFKYIDIDAIDNKRNVVTSVKVLNTKQAPSRASRYTEKGCVLFSMVRPYLRNIAMVTENDCIASTGFFVCQGKGCLLPKFCYYQMLSNYVVDGLNDFMKGDNSPSITKAQIEEYIFPLPPYNEQQRIVAKIEELFAVIDEIQKSIEA